jgi:beta-galactosidase
MKSVPTRYTAPATCCPGAYSQATAPIRRRLCAMVFGLFVVCSASAITPLPDWEGLYRSDLTDHAQLRNNHRAKISLNGVWRVALTHDAGLARPSHDDEYGYVMVPSSWMHLLDFPITGTPHLSLGASNVASTWKGQAPSAYPGAWYARTFKTPADIGERRVFLELERATIEATIFLNDHEIGRQYERDERRWDVTDHLAPPGEENRLAVRVVALLDEEVKAWLGGDETVTAEARATLRGITGDVWLHIEPVDPGIRDIFVIPSVREARLTIRVEVFSAHAVVETVAVKAEIFEPGANTPVKTIATEVSQLAEGLNVIELASAWPDAVWWDIRRPHLYHAVVSVHAGGRKRDESHPVRFGFREAWVEGRELMLNGSPLRLRSFHAAPHDTFVNAARNNIAREIEIMTDIGYNSIQLGFEGTFRRGHSAQYYHDLLDIADVKGVSVILPVFPVYSYDWGAPEGREEWGHHMSALLRRYRNHPSVLMYAMNFNYLGGAWDMNPHAWASDYKPPDRVANLGNKRRRALLSEAMLLEVDASRPVYHHASGNFGDFITSNFYPCWPPIQELEDSLSGWRATGKRPLIFTEFSLPVYILDLFRARGGNYTQVQNSEPLQAEYLAEVLGPRAYDLQSDSYLELVVRHATPGQQAGADVYNLQGPYVWGYQLRLNELLAEGMQRLRAPLLRSWRTYGLTQFTPNNRWTREMLGEQTLSERGLAGLYAYEDVTAPGPKPYGYHRPLDHDRRRTSVANTMEEHLRPILVYFGGAEEEGFSAKDHAWFSGDTIRKQVVVVNDSRESLNTGLQWQLTEDESGATVASGSQTIEVPSGTSAFLPIRMTAPETSTKSTYTLSATLPGQPADAHACIAFAVQVFPEAVPLPESVRSTPIALFDPIGDTAHLLDRLDIPYRRVRDHADPVAELLLLVGRGALSGENHLPSSMLERVTQDGATLLVFEQKNLDVFNLRLHARGVRTVFPLIKEHPVLSGLTPEDLSDWRGAISLHDPYPADEGKAPELYPEEFWKWSNRGVVSSYMIEKPHLGGLRPVAECGFDLNYTPLAEFREGRGHVILCQMEVTKRHGTDPAATQLFDQLLVYAATREPYPDTGAPMDPGDDACPLVARALGDRYHDLINIRWLRTRPDPGEESEWIAFVKGGGTVLLIGQTAAANLDWLPSPIRTESATYFRASPRSHPLMSGISAADLFIKDRRTDLIIPEQDGVVLLADPGLIATWSHGKGRFIFHAIDPLEYRDASLSPERARRIYHKLTRTLSIITANLDGSYRPLSANFLAGLTAGKWSLPPQWRFAMDPENRGFRNGWHKVDFNDDDWRLLDVPGYWESQGVTDFNQHFPEAQQPYDGFAWYRCSVYIPARFDSDDTRLMLGAIDDMDETFLNGQRIGRTSVDTSDAYAAIRDYPVPKGLIRPDAENMIAVRVYDDYGRGGMVGPELYIYRDHAAAYPYLNADPDFNPYRLKRW